VLDAKATINAESLVKARVIRRARDGVRLLGRGELKAKLTVEVHGASKSAIAAVEKAGGTVKILAPVKKDEGEAVVTSASSPALRRASERQDDGLIEAEHQIMSGVR